MDAAAESKVIGRVAADEKRVGVGLMVGIAIRRREDNEDAPAFRNFYAPDTVRHLRGPEKSLDRRFEAQCLVDGRRHEARVRAEREPLVGIRDQGEEQVTEEIRGGLVPRREAAGGRTRRLPPRRAHRPRAAEATG